MIDRVEKQSVARPVTHTATNKMLRCGIDGIKMSRRGGNRRPSSPSAWSCADKCRHTHHRAHTVCRGVTLVDHGLDEQAARPDGDQVTASARGTIGRELASCGQLASC